MVKARQDHHQVLAILSASKTNNIQKLYRYDVYPLVNSHITMEESTLFRTIPMVVFNISHHQRLNPIKIITPSFFPWFSHGFPIAHPYHRRPVPLPSSQRCRYRLRFCRRTFWAGAVAGESAVAVPAETSTGAVHPSWFWSIGGHDMRDMGRGSRVNM